MKTRRFVFRNSHGEKDVVEAENQAEAMEHIRAKYGPANRWKLMYSKRAPRVVRFGNVRALAW